MSDVPTAAISRLVTYLRILEGLERDAEGKPPTDPAHWVKSGALAAHAGVTAFQVRKDLNYFGRLGTRGTGYNVHVLRRELLRVLGLNQTWNVVIVGLGRLGQAITNYPGATDYQFQYVGLFDTNPALIGTRFHHLTVQHTDELAAFVQEQQVDMGFLAVPPEHAQEAAQALASAGVKGILNFAPIVIQPRTLERNGIHELSEEWRGVIVENVDFLAGMKRLTFYIRNPPLKDATTPEDTE